MRPLPSLRQLRYLVALVEHRHFTRAAEACFVTQSTLSIGLKELEASLGVQLVERDRQSVRITPAGMLAATRAARLLAEAEDLAESVGAAGKPMTGTLRLGVIPTLAPFLLPALGAAMRARHPALHLALREDLTVNLLGRLREGQLDIALIALPYDTSGLMVRALFDDELWLVALEDDPLLKAKQLAVSRQMTERLLILEEGHCLREHTLEACGRWQVASAEGLEATSLLTLLQMVDAGMGVALVPEIAVKSGVLEGTRLAARPLVAPAPKRGIALATRQTSARVAEFEALADVLLEQQPERRRKLRTSSRRPR